MVQVLPAVPTFGEKLAETLGRAGINIAEGYQQRQANQQLQGILKGVFPQAKEQSAIQNEGGAQPETPELDYKQTSAIYNATKKAKGKDEADLLINQLAKAQERQYETKENIRKENSKEIAAYAEPYKEISKFKSNINKLEQAKTLLKSGRVSFDDVPFRTAVSAFLEGNEKALDELSKTAEQQTFWSLIRPSIQSKELGGSNPSTRELLLEISSKPSMFKRGIANEAILGNMINDARTQLEKAETIQDLRRKSPYINPAEFISKIENSIGPGVEIRQQQHQSYINAKNYIADKVPPEGEVFVLGPDGQPGSVKKRQLQGAIEQGYTEL